MLAESVDRNRADALLLSGGLDSSILASILRPQCYVTAAFGEDAPDLAFARQVARKYGGRNAEVVFSHERMLELVQQIVQIFKTFDPIEIRNSSVALAGILQAKEDGYASIMTGDGADELFAGYNYLARYYSDLEKLDSELQRLWQVMHFSSEKLGEHAGITVKTPFLDDQFMSYAKSLRTDVKVGEHAGLKWGKFILRRCYESQVGAAIAWRPKLAQEQGAATDKFQNYVEQTIDDLTFANKSRAAKEEGVTLRNKEHLQYYAIFRSYFAPPKEERGELHCPQCGAHFIQLGRFCRTCGAFPVTPVRS